MIPDKNDPVWQKFVSDAHDFQFNSLATRMMYTRVKQLLRSDGSASEAIEIAYNFFQSNEQIAQADFEIVKNA